MDYYKYTVSTDASLSEMLMAFFGELPFDSFVEMETGFEAFLPADQPTSAVEKQMEALRAKFPFTFQREHIKGENWNEVWESNFHPVQVGDFCGIRADFHPPFENVEHELVINPKMAFGTGHHETTFSVIQLMQGMDFRGQKVFDYGCGTGVLAILASRLGAGPITAVDIEEQSYLNTLENAENNGVKNIRAIHGALADVPADTYGIVLANINRNVILDSLASLKALVPAGGLLVVSGFVLTDRGLMEKALAGHGFRPLETVQKNNWLAIKCER